MDDTCASYCETPAARCPNPHKPDSVFCDIHSLQHLAKYVKYKKLEANLHEVRDGQSVDYYLKLYAKLSNAYKVRFNFQEAAIAYSARDIGHQMRLDWLWSQSSLCVQHLETIFQAQSTEKPVQGSDLPQNRSVSQAERVQARKVFKTYTATKKRVEDYESLIKEAVNSDSQKVERELQNCVDNIRKRFGEETPTVEQLVRLGNFIVVCIAICKRDKQHTKYPDSAMLGSFGSNNNTERFRWGKLAYIFMMGYTSLYPDVDPYLEDTEVAPDQRLIKNFNVLVDLIRLIDRNGMVFFLTSPFLRAVYNKSVYIYIISNCCSALVVINEGLLEIRKPVIHFTDEQLSMFDYSQFIETNGNLDQLSTWRAHNSHTSLVDEAPLVKSKSPLYNAILITEYYTQAMALKLSVNDAKQFSGVVHTIFEQTDALAQHFASPELVDLVQQYYESDLYRQKLHNIADMLK